MGDMEPLRVDRCPKISAHGNSNLAYLHDSRILSPRSDFRTIPRLSNGKGAATLGAGAGGRRGGGRSPGSGAGAKGKSTSRLDPSPTGEPAARGG